MVRMTVLASGSRGNSTVVASSRTRILVDAGLSCRELFRRMAQANEDPRALDAILVTHEHQDHVQGLAVAARKLGIPVYFTEATHRAWVRWMTPRKRMTYADWLAQQKAGAAAREAAAGPFGNTPAEDYRAAELAACRAEEQAEAAGKDGSVGDFCQAALATGDSAAEGVYCEASEKVGSVEELCSEGPAGSESGSAEGLCSEAATDLAALPRVEYFRAGTGFSIGDIHVSAFTIPHDAADPVGFVLTAEGVRIGIATDLGYMPQSVSVQLKGAHALMLESNHDLDMLRDGPYPWSVKQRVLSRVGHLSNRATAEFLERNYDGEAEYVVLAHLSESNNLPELARIAAEHALRDRMTLLGNRLVLASQHEPTASLCF